MARGKTPTGSISPTKADCQQINIRPSPNRDAPGKENVREHLKPPHKTLHTHNKHFRPNQNRRSSSPTSAGIFIFFYFLPTIEEKVHCLKAGRLRGVHGPSEKIKTPNAKGENLLQITPTGYIKTPKVKKKNH